MMGWDPSSDLADPGAPHRLLDSGAVDPIHSRPHAHPPAVAATL